MLIEEQVSREISILSERIKNLFESHQLHDNSITKKSFRSIGSLVWNVRSFQFSDANRMTENPIKWILKVCTFARFDRWWPKTFFCDGNTTKFTRFQGIYRSSALLRDLAWHLLLDERCQFACSKQGFSMRLELGIVYGGWFSTIECSFKWIRAQWLSLLPLNPASELFGKSSVATFEAYSAPKASQDFMNLWTPLVVGRGVIQVRSVRG